MRIRARGRRSHAEPSQFAGRGRRSPFAVLCVLLSLAGGACGAGGIFRHYEYEEEIYLSLDGSATVYVNSSVAALNALRGTTFDADPAVRVDRAAVRAYFDTPVSHVTRLPTTWRRQNRRFVQVRMEVDDIRRLAEAAPFAWSTYQFGHDGNLFVYTQRLGASAKKNDGRVAWTGREQIAFRLHVPSKIEFHNTRTDGPKPGNILVWEQPLTERARGVPLTLEARMQTESILYRTLWLFGVTFVVVALTFASVIWWILRRAPAAGSDEGGPVAGPTQEPSRVPESRVAEPSGPP